MKITKNIKKMLSFTLLSSVLTVQANTNTLTAPKSLSDLFKKERLGMALQTYNSTIGTSDNIDGISQLNIANLYYTITPNDSLRWQNQVTTRFESGVDTEYTYTKSILKYTRSGILSQDKHGVNMSAAFEKRYLTDAGNRTSSNTYGHNRISTSLSRKINDKLSLGSTFFVALNDLRDSSNKETTRNYFLGIFSQSISLPKEISLTFFQEVFKANNGIDSNESESITFNADVSRSITDKLGMGFTVYSTPWSGSDELNYNNDFYKNLTYELGLNYRAF